jgi:uncharacterized phage-associated protein
MLRFDEEKATQAAALFLKLRGGRMHYLKLIKLLYLTDRAALLDWGIPVTTDRYVSMDNGPVLSGVYGLITEDRPKPVWAQFVSAPLGEYEVELLKEAPTDRLSRAEERLIHEVFDQWGHLSRGDLVDYVHTLPEWKDPKGSSLPIHIREILKAGGEEESEIRATIRELRSMAEAEESFASVLC